MSFSSFNMKKPATAAQWLGDCLFSVISGSSTEGIAYEFPFITSRLVVCDRPACL